MQKEKEPFPEDDIPENESSKEEEKIEEKKKEKKEEKEAAGNQEQEPQEIVIEIAIHDILLYALDKIFQFLNNIYLISGVCLLFCKILRFDMAESRPLLIKFAYITFAALILMFPPCMKKRIHEKEQPAMLPASLAVGFVLILMEFGFVMYAVW